jgi:hypothetical protein
MGWFNSGKQVEAAGAGVQAAGEGIKAAGEGVGTVLTSIRTMITGDLPPETVEALRELEVRAMEIQQNIQAGQQAIETAAINKGGFNSFFISAWRPMLGWISALAIFSYYIPPIILQTYFWMRQSIVSETLVIFPSAFDMADIMGLVGSLLGMSILRTIEKSQGTQANH